MCDKPKVDTTASDFARREAERARREDNRNQRKVDQGLKAVDAIFNGGRYVTSRERVYDKGYDPLSKKDITQTTVPIGTDPGANMGSQGDGDFVVGYPGGTPPAQLNGTVPGWEVGGKTFDTRKEAKGYVKDQNDKNSTVEKTFGKSEGTGPLLQERRQALRKAYIPELRGQYRDARDALTARLAEAGLINSTAAQEARRDLKSDFLTKLAEVKSNIKADIGNARSGLTDQKAAIESTLRNTYDVDSAVSGALTRLQNFGQTAPTINPLGDVFAGAGAGIGAVNQGYAYGAVDRELAALRPYLTSGTSREVRS